MLIRNCKRTATSDGAAVSADVIWEDVDRPPFTLKFEVPAEHASLIAPNPDAFLTAALFPARRAGERRVRVEGAACPLLVSGLETAMHWHRHWFGESCPVIAIECDPRVERIGAVERHGAMLFLSGGVDSLHTLRRNRIEVPAGHPASITHGLLVEGFDMRRGNTYARSLGAARAVAADAGVDLVPVRTNVRDLDLDDDFWDYQFHGAALASVAHAFAGRSDLAYLASSVRVSSLFPWGSHPLVDPLYTSADLKIRHDSADLTRIEKIRLLADWPAALDHMRVCYKHPQDSLNCSACEKCLRTMVELVAVGALGRAGAFLHRDVTPDMLGAVRLPFWIHREMWEDTIPGLRQHGREDLVAAVEELVARFRKWEAWKQERDWKGRIKRFDRRWTGGLIARIAAAR